jgi:DNA-directed RNA polymerase subunit RPC12/RpoP
MVAVTTKCTQCAAKLRLRDSQLIGREIRCPRCKAKFIARQVAVQKAKSDSPEPLRKRQVEEPNADFPNIQVNPEDQRETSRLRKRQKGSWLTIAAPLCFMALIGGLFAWQSSSPEQKAAPKHAVAHQGVQPKPNDASRLPAPTNSAVSPTTGTAISMDFIPVVPQLLFHFRPAEIWASKQTQQELVATLGNLGTWLHDFILQTTRFEPTEIEELTVAINFGARTNASDLAVVARLVNEQSESHLLLKRIRGTLIPDLDAEVFESNDLAFTIIDSKTLAISSLDLAGDLADARKYAAVPQSEMESLLEQSDHSRHATLITDLHVFDVHKDLVLMKPLHRLAESALLWIGTDCRLLSWSVHLQPHFHMQTTLIPMAELSTTKLERRMQDQLGSLPERLQTLAGAMHPPTVGHRQLIGRFPVMMQAFVWGTQVSRLKAGATLTTVLPQKAAANLAAGATLTWNQSIRKPSSQPAIAAVADPTEAESVTKCLQRSVLIDFRREPLQEALAYIGREIGVATRIDGDALKLAGLTQNMQQTHNLGDVSAVTALDAILRQYEGVMVIVVDETQRTLLLTTQSAAAAQKLTIFDITAKSQP